MVILAWAVNIIIEPDMVRERLRPIFPVATIDPNSTFPTNYDFKRHVCNFFFFFFTGHMCSSLLPTLFTMFAAVSLSKAQKPPAAPDGSGHHPRLL